MNKTKLITHRILRCVSTFFLGFWIYETIEEGWAGNGKWLITWAVLLVIHTICEIYYEKEVKYNPLKEIPAKTRVKFLDRCRAAITAFRHPGANAAFREALLTINRSVPVLKKEFKIQSVYGQVWINCGNLNGPSDEGKAHAKKHAMAELIKALEPYTIVQDYTDPIDCIYRLMVELKVIVPDKEEESE